MCNGLKYSFLFLLLCAVCATGCSKDDEGIAAPKRRPTITFAAPIVAKPATKGYSGPMFSNYSIRETFKFWAQWDEVEFHKWDGAQGVAFLRDMTAKYNPDLKGWSPHDGKNFVDYDWPMDGVLTFSAFSPADLSERCTGCTYAYGAQQADDGEAFTGLSIDNYVIPADTAGQIDIMYAKRAYNKTAATALPQAGTQYNAVDLVFQHALSLVRVTVRLDHADPVDHFLTKIEVTNLCYKGSFKEYVLESYPWSDYKTSTMHRKWDLGTPPTGGTATAPAKKNFVIFDGTTHPVKLGEEPAVPRFFRYMILMPQRFAKSQGPGGGLIDSPDAKLVITYSKNGVEQKVERAFGQMIPAWLGGKVYTYNVSIGSSEIGFDPNISQDWTDDFSGVVINPAQCK